MRDDDIIGNSPPLASLTVLRTTHVNAVSGSSPVTVALVAPPSGTSTLELLEGESGELQNTL